MNTGPRTQEDMIAVMPMLRSLAEVGVAQDQGLPKPPDFDELWVQSIQIAAEHFLGEEIDIQESSYTKTIPLDLALYGFQALGVLALRTALIAVRSADDFPEALRLLDTLARYDATLDTESDSS